MKFHMESAQLFVPDGLPIEEALARTTYLGVSAHQDDLEIMAGRPILQAYQQPDRWFTGLVVADGRGSPRSGLYENYTDDEMQQVRIKEQKKAAYVGEYAALVMLDYPSKVVKDGSNRNPVEDIIKILEIAQPEEVYTHSASDKHDTHVATLLRVVEAIRSLPAEKRPKKLYGCEVWRDLDWMTDEDKVPLDVSEHENLQAALLGVYDSQIAGGKRYDLATMGRRKAHATYFASHGIDVTTGLNFAMDLTPLITDPSLDVKTFVQGFIDRFAEEVRNRLSSVGA
ncbi:MAG: PIG-L deacetylase family protein [Anaerolineae bacterium]|jgi:LmbE family N-acetylglucosaminyl deacetylase